MDVECLNGLKAALKSFDTIDYGSHVHINYEYVLLNLTRLLAQFPFAQMRHRNIRLCAVRNRKDCKPSHEESLPQLPHTMAKCSPLKEALEGEFRELMDVVQADADMLRVWKLCNRSGGVYQRRKEDFERQVRNILRERSLNGSYTALRGPGAYMSVLRSSAK